MTPEQKKALALARARLRVAGAKGAAAQAVQPGQVPVDAQGRPTGPQAPPRADAPPSPPVAEPAWPQTGAGTLLDAMAGASEGLLTGAARTLGFIPDVGLHAINQSPKLLNLLPGEQGMGPMSEDPVTVTDTLDSILHLGMPKYEPQTGAGRFTGRVAEEVGGALAPGVAAVKVAEKMGKPAINAIRDFNWREAGSYLPGFAKSLLRPAQAAPGRFLKQEAYIGTGAGLGAAGTNYVTGNEDGENPWVDAAGAVGGASAAGLAGAILPRLGDIVAALSGNAKYASNYAKEGVAAQIAANSDVVGSQLDPNNMYDPLDTDTLVAKLFSSGAINDAVPNYRPTTAELAGDRGLLNLQGAREGQENASRFRARKSDNIDAVEEALLPSAPTENSARFTGDLADERNRRVTDAELAAILTGKEAEAASRSFAPQASRAERGGAIRTGIEDAREAARARTGAAYRASGAGEVPADAVAVRAAIDTAAKGLTEVRKGLLPSGVIERVRRLGAGGEETVDTGILDALGRPVTRPGDAPEPINMDEVIDLRSELGRLRSAAAADPRAENGGRNAAEAMDRVIKVLDGYIDAALPPDQKALLDEARAAKFDEAEAFGRQGDPLAAATARGPGGTSRMRDDSVATSFTDPQNIDKLFAQAPTDEVRSAVKEEILSRGDFSTAEGAMRFRTKYAEQLKRFPGLAAEVEKAASARGAAEAASGKVAALGGEIGPGGTSAVAGYLKYGDERAERAMSRVVNGDRPAEQIDELLRFVGDDPASVQGARKAFWEVMEKEGRSQSMAEASKSGTMPWDTGKWRKFMGDEGKMAAAKRLYRDAPEHWANVQKIQGALQELGTQKAAVTAANPSKTFSSQKGSAVNLAEVQSKYYEVARGRVNPLYMITYLGTRIANRAVGRQSEQAFKALLDKALLDPEVAAALLTEFNPATRAALRRSASGWIGSTGANLLDSLMEPDDPVLDAVGEK